MRTSQITFRAKPDTPCAPVGELRAGLACHVRLGNLTIGSSRSLRSLGTSVSCASGRPLAKRYALQENRMERSQNLQKFLNGLKSDLPSFEEADFTDINWCNHEGENALHIAVIRNELSLAKELIDLGIEINARGDLGHTPLHEAASMCDLSMVKLLVESGADLHALTEGNPPFTLARFSKKDDICDYLGAEMNKVQQKDPTAWAKAQISYLKREIARI